MSVFLEQITAFKIEHNTPFSPQALVMHICNVHACLLLCVSLLVLMALFNTHFLGSLSSCPFTHTQIQLAHFHV